MRKTSEGKVQTEGSQAEETHRRAQEGTGRQVLFRGHLRKTRQQFLTPGSPVQGCMSRPPPNMEPWLLIHSVSYPALPPCSFFLDSVSGSPGWPGAHCRVKVNETLTLLALHLKDLRSQILQKQQIWFMRWGGVGGVELS